jgi:hypothetical protein
MTETGLILSTQQYECKEECTNMSKRLYVGNLPFNLTLEAFKAMFEKYGTVTEATIVTNKFNGRSKGFGFVTFESDEAGDKAKTELNGSEVEGRKLTVNEATPFNPDAPRPERRGGFGGRGGGFGGRGGGRGFGGPRRFGGGDRDGGRGFGGRRDDRGSSDNF